MFNDDVELSENLYGNIHFNEFEEENNIIDSNESNDTKSGFKNCTHVRKKPRVSFPDDDIPLQNNEDDSKEDLFTVEKNIELKKKPRWHKKISSVSSLIKVVAALLLASLMLFCVVASKFSIIYITKYSVFDQHNKNITNRECDRDIPKSCVKEVSLIMLCIAMMIPPFFTFIKQAIVTFRKVSYPWPTKQAIFWGVSGTIMETVGIALFFIVTMRDVKDTNLNIILMNGMLIFPTMGQIWREVEELSYEKEMQLPEHLIKKRRKSQTVKAVMILLALVLQIGGICGILYMVWDKKSNRPSTIISTVFSVVLIGIAWSPKLRELQIDQDLAYVYKDNSIEHDQQDTLPLTRHMTLSSTLSLGDVKKQKKSILQTFTSRGKASLMNSFLKLQLIPILFLLLSYLFDTANIGRLHEGFYQFTESSKLIYMFIVHVCASFFGYHVAVVCCSTTLQRISFALPLTLSTPICVVLVLTENCDRFYIGPCKSNAHVNDTVTYAILSIALWLGQCFATAYYIWKLHYTVIAAESKTFWVPQYDGSLLEQNILLNRKNETTNEFIISYRQLVKKATIYICTTMYHEADYEMEQLLFSIAGVDKARRHSGRNFEAHIWFDDGVRDKTLKSYAIQLISLLSSTVEVMAEDATKLLTPYGMQLKWILPGGMPFFIHFKDNFKVKNKKRWSQVMYMSYVLDFKQKDNLDHSFILTTDADVKFMPEDVSALMDFMVRDPSVGAVCGRTYPMGSGPMVWYQKFDYAIGHWFLKVAEHVLGSVLCSPGCFSIYRCRAVEDILPTYATSVECAMDFLKKDMGEDRWMCTLLIEHGWRLDYCASSSNATYCPETFDEFFKQRRRWGPSTLANQFMLIQSQSHIRKNNDNINVIFVIYQVFSLISVLVGPSTVLLLIASGLHTVYPNDIDLIPMFLLHLIVVSIYVYICMYHSQKLQLKIGLLLTFLYSIVMAIVVVGLIILVVNDFENQSKNGWKYFFLNDTGKYLIDISNFENGADTPGIIREFSFQFTPPSIFLFFLIGLFLLTAILHGKEGFEVIHGIWYMLCIPSCYLFLMIYSLANITDRSWGTREGNSKNNKLNTKSLPWNYIIYYKMKETFFCCFKNVDDDYKEQNIECTDAKSTNCQHSKDNQNEELREGNDDKKSFATDTKALEGRKTSVSSNPKLRKQSTIRSGQFTNNSISDDNFQNGNHIAIPIQVWCSGIYSQYTSNFKRSGYDDTSFLMKLKEDDLIDIGIVNRGHRKQLLAKIEQLPPTEIEQDVPEDVETWLSSLGLLEYWSKFKENTYDEPDALADLKMMDLETLSATFNITKKGHLKKMIEAISQLKYSTSEQKKLRQFKREIEKIKPKKLSQDNPAEYKFWDRLRKVCLLKEQAAFSQSTELHSKLFDLRNTTLAIFGICNALWLTIMLAIISQGDKLTLFKTSFLSVAFLILNAIVMVVQFASLLVHRFSTWLHYISRASFKPGSKGSKSWSFADDELFEEPSSEEIEEIQKYISLKLRRRSELRDKQALQRANLATHAPLFRTGTNNA